MGTCPKCSAPIDSGFGILNCSRCNVLLIVDLDGSVQVAGEDGSEPVSEPLPSVPQEPDGPHDFGSDQVSEGIPSQDYQESIDVIEEAKLRMEDDKTPVPFSMPQQTLEPTDSKKDRSGLGEILSYANSETSQGREGMYLFDIHISGIDSRELRASLKEALTDKKMAWDVDAILRSVSKGQLIIQKLSAVKAGVLINRMRTLPFEVTWTQSRIVEPGAGR